MAAAFPAPSRPADPALDAYTARLVAALGDRTGIRLDRSLPRKLARQLVLRPVGGLEEWVSRLEALPAEALEWQSVIEPLTIHETYFFRDLPFHAFLGDTVLPEIIATRRAGGDRTLRLWSAGCATGEEPYSLAMVAFEALGRLGEAARTEDGGIASSWQVEVLGTDLSQRAVTHAVAGVYGGEGLGPFRDLPPGHETWFEQDPRPGFRRVRDGVRRVVRFQPYNLMAPTPPAAGFDLVVCRNVMIYFDDTARAVAQDQLV
ncbi:MAG TPA: CheR family methyltransferase, partial [Azospirillaceae bacterium]|nr:CheR family methyltransferase [Azospirillaceae bacterium]